MVCLPHCDYLIYWMFALFLHRFYFTRWLYSPYQMTPIFSLNAFIFILHNWIFKLIWSSRQINMMAWQQLSIKWPLEKHEQTTFFSPFLSNNKQKQRINVIQIWKTIKFSMLVDLMPDFIATRCLARKLHQEFRNLMV